MKLKRKKLGLKFLYNLKSNSLYIDTLNTLDNNKDDNYEENERSIRPTGVHLRRLEQRYVRTVGDRRDEADTTIPVFDK